MSLHICHLFVLLKEQTIPHKKSLNDNFSEDSYIKHSTSKKKNISNIYKQIFMSFIELGKICSISSTLSV